MKSSKLYRPDPKLFPNALEIKMGPEFDLKKSGTKYDDPNFNPWDAVAKELISNDSKAVNEAYEETKRYIAWRQSMGMDSVSIKKGIEENTKLLAASDELIDWLDRVDSTLEKIDTSSWHRFTDAIRADMILTEDAQPAEHVTPFIVEGGAPQHFLIQHEWMKLLSTAGDEKGNALNLEEFRLPFERCSFEMKMKGKRVILIMHELNDQPMRIMVLIECSSGIWYVGKEYDFKQILLKKEQKHGPGLDFMMGNIAAMCICIEANVIETEVVRAPHKLNASRFKAGKTPLLDHTVVSLSRRYRVSNPLETPGDGKVRSGKRMHFRRGHWRHYADHKTWIKWMLVGNPDLGFVEHEYRA